MQTPLHTNIVSENTNVPRSSEDMSGVSLFLWEIVKVCFLAFIIIIPVRAFLFQPFIVRGLSMTPNFQNGEYLVIGELGYKRTIVSLFGGHLFTVEPYKTLQRQEVVVFRPPISSADEQFFIKRVIGLPGDTVEIKNGRVIIRDSVHPSGFTLDESAYLSDSVPTFAPSGTTFFSLTLKEDEYFMMGDNRLNSHDSRAFGAVDTDHIIGRVLIRAWPFDVVTVY